eukprot:2200531-Amphidinium_carterae.1
MRGGGINVLEANVVLMIPGQQWILLLLSFHSAGAESPLLQMVGACSVLLVHILASLGNMCVIKLLCKCHYEVADCARVVACSGSASGARGSASAVR